MTKFSIIIPHHNIPNLLLRCLQSIPQRDDLQVIVVDDGSNEENIVKVREIAKDNKLVDFIFNTPARGGGYARNLALAQARGEYILFADADDFFTPCLNDVLNDYVDCTEDMVFFNAISLDTDTYMFSHRCWQLNAFIAAYRSNKKKALWNLRYRFGEPWCKMIRRDMIKKYGIRFDETKIHNDTTFSYMTGFYGKSLAVDERALYCVTSRRGSVSRQTSVERWLIRTEVFARANAFFKLHNVRISDERAFRGVFHFLLNRDIKHVRACFGILKNNGLSDVSILWKLIGYPIAILRKLLSEYFVKRQLKKNIKE